MKSRAAIALAAGKSLELVDIDVQGPKAGEVLVRIVATSVCHTDAYTLSGADPEGVFPAVLGHEGAGIVEEVGEGVTSVKVGDGTSSAGRPIRARISARAKADFPAPIGPDKSRQSPAARRGAMHAARRAVAVSDASVIGPV